MKAKRINVMVSDELKLSVKLKATAEGKSITQVVVLLLEKWLASQCKKNSSK